MRHALFAERLAPSLAASSATLEQSLANLSPEAKGAAATAKLRAKDQGAMIRALLYPEDDDG